MADQGNGTYKNPVLYADYSDPDVCRVGDDYYLTSSSFNCLPGLQILHSKDLVNWTIIGAAVPYALPLLPMSVLNMATVYGHPVSATITVNSIYSGVTGPRSIHGESQRSERSLSEPVLVKAGKGIIDTTPLWDDDGRVYLVHAYAGSRAD